MGVHKAEPVRPFGWPEYTFSKWEKLGRASSGCSYGHRIPSNLGMHLIDSAEARVVSGFSGDVPFTVDL
ncbi:hypothetical protein NHX12_012101 [Muraenolepis orangiensis]|uniref:Uncharacterized protein n=1 Tax=Muraenolepis orangiensis TaxID=630683 RepID=A0A9Q0DHI4_9TELE|nr:hypothetical protein NHX12_012101 [Muraenolepis orangiensis]